MMALVPLPEPSSHPAFSSTPGMGATPGYYGATPGQPIPAGFTTPGQLARVSDVPMDAFGNPLVDAKSLKLQQAALNHAKELKKKEDMAIQMAIAISSSEAQAPKNEASVVEQGAVELAI